MSSIKAGYDFFGRSNCGLKSINHEDFQEEDIWSIINEGIDHNNSSSKITTFNKSSSFTSRHISTTPKMIIPRAKTNPITDSSPIRNSAPVNIPDWSNFHGKKSNVVDYLVGGGGDDDDDDDGGMMPPHEWLARKLERSQIMSSFSVCEGAGRTLKGRDLSRVRNAVLTKTGFLE